MICGVIDKVLLGVDIGKIFEDIMGVFCLCFFLVVVKLSNELQTKLQNVSETEFF